MHRFQLAATAVLVVAALGAAVLAAPGPVRGAVVPAGFTDTEVASGFSAPTAMALAPDGRIFVLQQTGSVRVIKNGQLLGTPFVSLNVDSNGERGLLGIAFDPSFATNGFVYLYYTTSSAPTHNRVSRFTASGDVAVAGSEQVVLDLDNLSGATNHNGGALHFGPDGKLYLGVGENATDSNAQTLSNLLGKLLRFNSDGTIPSDNPFVGTAMGRNQAIWVLGLRNPFTFGFQPGTGRLFVNDVGASTWEEINDGARGANYGWPTTEGPTSDPRYVSPIYAYRHSSGTPSGCAITGGAFYNPTQPTFPAAYLGNYFFADLCGGWIARLDPASGNAVTPGFATGISTPVDLLVTPGGDLLYLARGSGGTLRRISFVGGGGATPSISSFSPTSGAAGSTIVTINGANLTGATQVTFNGRPASFSVSGSSLRATVPNGATSGRIAVTTPAGSATSASSFAVNFTISGFSPTSGSPGTVVTITGAGFSFFSTARFNGFAASTQVISSNQLRATVPSAATSGPITVTRFGTPSTTTSATAFTATGGGGGGGGGGGSAPSIASFSPGSGATGASVAINGVNFTGASLVRFNGRAAAFTIDSPTRITATVPDGASTGRITVITPAGTATSSSSFTVTLSVMSFSPTSGAAGTTVLVRGVGFAGATAVRFNGASATFSTFGSTFISARVPTGATSGPISVTTPAGTARSATRFTKTS